MKKLIKRLTTFCDYCKGQIEDYREMECIKCGKHLCPKCQEKHSVTYRHAVYCSGSYDGYYCKKCDQKLRESMSDPLWLAYNKVLRLKTFLSNHDLEIKKQVSDAGLAVVKAYDKHAKSRKTNAL